MMKYYNNPEYTQFIKKENLNVNLNICYLGLIEIYIPLLTTAIKMYVAFTASNVMHQITVNES